MTCRSTVAATLLLAASCGRSEPFEERVRVCASGEAQPCYPGPARTRGVGACRDGARGCLADGSGFGECTGAVLPAPEDLGCADGVDNDCDGETDCGAVCRPGETEACYPGPEETRGVGACRDGVRTCLADRSGFGECVGAVLPALEDPGCSNAVDDDCDGMTDCADVSCMMALVCCVPDTHETALWANSSSALYRVDPVTFEPTLVGPFSVDEMTDIAVMPDGTLYAISRMSLYRVDASTARPALVSQLDWPSIGLNALTFLPDGRLLAADNGTGKVVSIDPRTGAVVPIGQFGQLLASSGDLVAVEGVMYGVSSTHPDGMDASGNNLLLTVDATTGLATVVGFIGFGRVYGLAYAGGRVIGFCETGEIIEVDVQTARGKLLVASDVSWWGAGMSPLTPANPCP